eukprot:jgi/Mesen1/6674/ME000343S05842
MDDNPGHNLLSSLSNGSSQHDATKGLNFSMIRDRSSGQEPGLIDSRPDMNQPTTFSILGRTLTPFAYSGNASRNVGNSFSMTGMCNNSMDRQIGSSSIQQQASNNVQFPQLMPEENQQTMGGASQNNQSPQSLMNALNLLQQNIGALQALVPLIAQSNFQPGSVHQAQQLQQQQAAASAGVATVISQLAVAAAGILPQMGIQQSQIQQQQQVQISQYTPVGNLQLGQSLLNSQNQPSLSLQGLPGFSFLSGSLQNNAGQLTTQHQNRNVMDNSEALNADQENDDDGYVETLPEGSYEVVEMDPVEIMAEHTHFCEICGKGFKRDANLRMHMRGHGDEYKTTAALSRPDKVAPDTSSERPKRFSCPYIGCKRNKKHRKFQPLKTMLCVKNHYRRSHCPKMLTCSKCNSKKFSVVADLKTHEKHCGRDKWIRKDKLLGHLSLFAGHTPAMPLHIMEEGINNSGKPSSQQNSAVQMEYKSMLASSLSNSNSPNNGTNRTGLLAGSAATNNGSNLGNNSLLQHLFTSNFLENSLK